MQVLSEVAGLLGQFKGLGHFADLNEMVTKLEDKIYINFSGYPGGKKEETAKSLLKRRPEAVIERAVKGMLPKNRLGRKMYKKLFVYAGAEHPHGAQQPKTLKF